MKMKLWIENNTMFEAGHLDTTKLTRDSLTRLTGHWVLFDVAALLSNLQFYNYIKMKLLIENNTMFKAGHLDVTKLTWDSLTRLTW